MKRIIRGSILKITVEARRARRYWIFLWFLINHGVHIGHREFIYEELFMAAQYKLQNNINIPSSKAPRNPLAGLIEYGKYSKKMVMQGGLQNRVYMIKCTNSACDNKASSFHFVEEKLIYAAQDKVLIPYSIIDDLNERLENLQNKKNGSMSSSNKVFMI